MPLREGAQFKRLVLHLIRVDSIAPAVEAFPQAESIYEANMAILERLGHAGWEALAKGWA